MELINIFGYILAAAIGAIVSSILEHRHLSKAKTLGSLYYQNGELYLAVNHEEDIDRLRNGDYVKFNVIRK